MSDPAFPDPGSRNVLRSGCPRCPDLVASRERISWGTGSLDADVMVVGEAPGAGDPDRERWRGGNWTGMAYTAAHSGRRIRALFESLGYGPDDCYVTNAVKCFPADGAGGNREPTAEERRTCFSHLRSELDAVDPAVVVTTGKHATTALLEAADRAPSSFLDAVLDPVACPTLGTTVVPILHPSYQDVWIPRLGYDADGYRRAIGETLDRLGV